MYQFVALICLLLLGLNINAQEINQSAWVDPIKNSSGDPTTNILDPNGAKQGEWYFQDALGNVFFKQKYVDNQLVASFVKHPSAIENWLNISNYNVSTSQVNDVENLIREFLIKQSVKMTNNQQLFVLKDAKSRVFIAFIGDWKKDFVKENSTKLKLHIENHLLNSEHEFYAIIN